MNINWFVITILSIWIICAIVDLRNKKCEALTIAGVVTVIMGFGYYFLHGGK